MLDLYDEVLSLATAAIQAIDPNASSMTDEDLVNLSAAFPEKLVIAALDLIDRRNVIHYLTTWGHIEYEVLGSTETGANVGLRDSASSYSVLLDIQTSRFPYSCSCHAFLHSVLRLDTHIMHILAALIARRMNISITRLTGADELAALFIRQYPTQTAKILQESGKPSASDAP